MPRPALILFIKAPRPGTVKTRLTPYLTGEEAAQVAVCLAQDAVRLASQCLPSNGCLIVAYTPNDGWPEIEHALSTRNGEQSPSLIPLRQTGADLGERMANAVQQAATLHDLGPLVLLGADCPVMPLEAVAIALAALGDSTLADAADIVLGPAEDGGYYLLGLGGHEPLDLLFEGVVWSQELVFGQTAENAERLSLRVRVDLPVCYDIDTPEDLMRLRGDLLGSADLAGRAPHMARWLAENPLPPLPLTLTTL